MNELLIIDAQPEQGIRERELQETAQFWRVCWLLQGVPECCSGSEPKTPHLLIL